MTKPSATWTRRQVLKSGSAFGITLALYPMSVAAASFGADETMPIAPGWNGDGRGGQPTYRIDGLAKVTGAKVYARDFRAADMPGWPDETAHAMLLFAGSATRMFIGLDLSSLSADLQPDRIVTAEDITKANIAATGFFKTDLFCAKGQTPAYLGQPVALLIYHDLPRFSEARQALRGASGIITYGDETPPLTADPYGSNRFTRVAGDDPKGPDIYSPVKDGWVGPIRYQKAQEAVWADPNASGNSAEEASFYGAKIRKDLASGDAGERFTIEFETQSIDQVFMEPESGLAWHDAASKRLAVLLGVQSPEACLEAVGGLLSKATGPYAVDKIDAYFAYLGGGFGGKDHTIMPLYIALAGLYGDGRPVRLALDRFDQFQFGLKRHAFAIKNQLGVDPKTGLFQAFACDLSCDGGGRSNFSASVADVAATAATSIYYLPKSDITTIATHSRGVTAGSMRGYGTLQSMTAMECLVDEVASKLKQDPIALRRKNALQTGQLNLTGNAASGAVRTDEVLAALEKSELWTDRAKDKQAFEAANPSKAYGVGVACVMKDYGTGGDGVLASVSLGADGRITASSNSIEMGTGISTAVAIRVADRLGQSADSVKLYTEGFWEPLKLVTSNSPWAISQSDQDAAAKNPRWTPQISSPASASIGAHVNTHAIDEAAHVILRHGLWPAAMAIWSEGPLKGQVAGEAITFEDLRWVDDGLTGSGLEPLPLATLAKRAHEMGLVTGAIVHAFSRWSWATAEFTVGGENYVGAIDALAVQSGTDAWQLLDRTSVAFPPAAFERIGVNYYSACGAVVALAVDKTDGSVEVKAVHQVLEAGRQIVPDLVSGIGQGGIAMGIGQALHEYLPLYEDGPGNGSWNLNRYRVPMAADLPIWKMTMDVLPPLSETDPPKGMAEVVMIPVIPGVLNALHDATGKRFTKLPVTADDVLGAL